MDNITARLTQAQNQISTDMQTQATDIPSLEAEVTNLQILVMAISEQVQTIALNLDKVLQTQTPPTNQPPMGGGMMGV